MNTSTINAVVPDPSTENKPHHLMQYFQYSHLPEWLQGASKGFHDLAAKLDESLPPCDQKDKALQKLIEAKDCAVRAMLVK